MCIDLHLLQESGLVRHGFSLTFAAALLVCGEVAAQDTQANEPSAPPSQEPAPQPAEPDITPTGEEDQTSDDLNEPPTDEPVAGAQLERSEAETTAEPPGTQEEAERETQLPWRNSYVMWDQSINAYAFSESSQLTHNPTYRWTFSVRPRWYINDNLYVRLRQDLEWELTDSDTTTTQRELWLYDTIADITRTTLLSYQGIELDVGGRLRFPTSKTSRAAHRIVGAGAYALADRTFEQVLEGLTPRITLEAIHYFATSNVTHTEEDFACRVLDSPDGAPRRDCSNIGGPSTVQNDFRLGIGAELVAIERLAVDVSFLWWWTRGHALETAYVDVDTASGGVVGIDDQSDTHWRNSTWFSIDVSYDVTDYLSTSLGMSTLSPQLAPDGDYYNPFFNVYTELALNATVTLDQLYNAVRGRSTNLERDTRRNVAAGRRPSSDL